MAEQLLQINGLKVSAEDKEILHGIDSVSYTHLNRTSSFLFMTIPAPAMICVGMTQPVFSIIASILPLV